MSLTREFKDTVVEMCKDPEYRRALLLEVLESYLDGDVDTVSEYVRSYLKATIAALYKDPELIEVNLAAVKRVANMDKDNPMAIPEHDERLLTIIKELETSLQINVKVSCEEVGRLVVADLVAKYKHNKKRGDKEWADKFEAVLRYYLDDEEIEMYLK